MLHRIGRVPSDVLDDCRKTVTVDHVTASRSAALIDGHRVHPTGWPRMNPVQIHASNAAAVVRALDPPGWLITLLRGFYGLMDAAGPKMVATLAGRDGDRCLWLPRLVLGRRP